jgi:Tol biopolymer transport system component
MQSIAVVTTFAFVVFTGCARDPTSVRNGLIAFPARDAAGHQQIFTIEPNGSARTQLTFVGDSWLPSWSPDGTQLAYAHRDAASTKRELMIMNADGSDQHAIGVDGDAPSWGSDGRIVFVNALDQSPPEIFVVDPRDPEPRQVTPSGNHRGRIHPDWSPDGKRVVYMEMVQQADDDTSNGCPFLEVRPSIWTIAVDGTDPQRVTQHGEAHNVDANGGEINTAFDANAPDWGPDIVFWSGQESCYGQVWKAHADGTGRAQLTEAPLPSHNDDPAWSPDGTQVLFTSDRNGKPEVFVMNADGSDERPIVENTAGPGPGDSAWQPVFD